jgi:hypothetical protein
LDRNNRQLNYYLHIFLVFILSFSVGCRITKKTVIINPESEKPTVEEVKVKFDFKSAKVLADKMEENKFKYNLLTSKFSAETNIDGKSSGFNVSIRAKSDSILWMSFSLLGIEGARVLATPDTIKFIDRVNHKYIVCDYQYISKMLSADVDFEMLQSILVGNSVEFYGEEEKIKSFREDDQYVLSTVRKRKLKKVINKVNDGEQVNELVQRTYLENESYKISRNLINDFSTNRTFDAKYTNFQKVDNFLFPFSQHFEINSGKKILVDIIYNKVEPETELTFPFNIPAKYESIR